MDGLKSALSSDPECGLTFGLFLTREKSEKTLHQRGSRELEEDAEDPGMGESLEGRHQAHENPRTAPQSAQNCVLERQAAL